MKLSPWIVIDKYCATRVILGTDPTVVKNRIAFIEKTPRIKLEKNKFAADNIHIKTSEELKQITRTINNTDFWIYGPKGSGGGDAEKDKTYGFDENSRRWCDNLLVLLGYELEN